MLTIGAMLQNRYRIVSLLGQGGMGAVYRAWDTRLQIAVALKEMTAQPGIDAQTLNQLRQQFQQEAAVLARLSHPNLVRVSDFFEEQDNAYLVMNFVEGESLAQQIQHRGALPEAEVVAWAEQLLDALTYVHSQGVLHRDLKPQNVILRPDGQPILVDFGLVKLWDPRDPHTRTAIRSMGTPEYAPPEQYDAASPRANGGHTDPRSDIYALGATLYHALTGQAPPTATMRIVDPRALQPVRTLNPHVSTHVEAVLSRALELRPEGRFRSATDMRSALKGVPAAHAAVVPPAPPRTSPPSAAPHSGPSPWLWLGLGGGALLLLILLVGGGIAASLLLDQHESTPTAHVVASITPYYSGESGQGTPILPSATPTHLPPPPTPTTPAPDTPLPAASETPVPPPPSPTVPPIRPTALPTSPPTVMPTPTCPPVTGPFADTWAALGDRLGCSTTAVHNPTIALEHFEGGLMLWRENTDQIYVLYGNGSWDSYNDIWLEGDPEYSCPDSAPSSSPPTPRRGFGKIWCTDSEVRSGLGSATDAERGFYGTVQDFRYGWALGADSGVILVLFADGSWTQR